jgi:trimethylamine---corrinoid protein Co-methyltransferase
VETLVQVLSAEECSRIHEETLIILGKTGVRIDTERGRNHLGDAGAIINKETHIVRFPPALVEQCIFAAPKEFTLGARRPGKLLPMNKGLCGVVMDGGAIYTYDSKMKVRRPATKQDWFLATQLGECLDEVDVYWSAIGGCWGDTPGEVVAYWKAVFQNFTKHIQDATMTVEESRWMLEVFDVVFGGRDEFRNSLPVSFILCPASPLVIEGEYTDAYLETLEWGMPVAIMTMPLLGISSPASLISELILANCETLAMLCLIQTAAPGTPIIYAAAPVIANMRSGRFGSGEVEHALLGAAVTQISRMYGLPVENSACGTDQSVPCIQAGYERALNYTLPILSRPDLLVAPGLLGGSTIFSPEQLVIDTEVIRRCKRLSRGIESSDDKWLRDVITEVAQGGNYLKHPSTRKLVRSGEVYNSKLGHHGSYKQWKEAGSPEIVAEIWQEIDKLLASEPAVVIPEDAMRELENLEKRARNS